MQDSDGIAAKPVPVIPTFPEAEFQVSDRGTVDGDLSVVPGRPYAIDGCHRLTLAVAVMVGVVTPAVT
jgi:hypothetical protein